MLAKRSEIVGGANLMRIRFTSSLHKSPISSKDEAWKRSRPLRERILERNLRELL